MTPAPVWAPVSVRTVPLAVLNVAPLVKLSGRLEVKEAVLVNVPPSRINAPEAAPRLASALTLSFPADSTVPPL